MKRLEPNLLLALTCLMTLALLILTGSVFGVPGGALKYPLMAAICIIAFIIGNGLLQRQMKRTTPPMISLDNPRSAAWAGLFPMVLMILAGIPVFWTGHDYGLLIIIGSVMTGLTIESALKARKAG
ncbi:MAG: hypothetical protein JWR59_1558 [Brevundimonas sp.]|nr:hypothetical protein [Brevundimonas sp.]